MPGLCGLPGCRVEVAEGGRCSRCKVIEYCGAAHQREDWKRHREVCREMAAARREEKVLPPRGPTMLRVLCR
jgi:hypothetical protein